MFGGDPIFGDDLSWTRAVPPNLQEGIYGFEEYNQRWEQRKMLWTMPLDWVNYGE